MNFSKIEATLFKWAFLAVVAMVAWGLVHPQKPTVTTAPGVATAIVQATPKPLPLPNPVTVVAGGLTPEQFVALASALLHAPTQTQIAANTHVVSKATPLPTPSAPTDQHLYNVVYGAAYNADAAVTKQEQINTNVTISQVPVAPSRYGAGYALMGSQNGGALFEYNVPLNQSVSFAAGASIGKKVDPVAGFNYRINGFRVGPIYDPITRRWGIGLTYSL